MLLKTVRLRPQPSYPEGTTFANGTKMEQSQIMARQASVLILIVLAFGVLVPWYKSFTLLDPRMIVAYACLAILFVAPASAEAAARSQDRSARAVLGSIAAVVAYGWGVSLLILVTAFVTLNLTNWRGAVLTPPAALSSAALLFSLSASVVVAILSTLLARRFSAAGVKTILRLGFLLILLALVFSSRLPEEWQIVLAEHSTRRAITRLAWEGSAVCAILAILLLIPLMAHRQHK